MNWYMTHFTVDGRMGLEGGYKACAYGDEDTVA